MRFVSTRGGVEPKNFEDVILTGLAPDGGCLFPSRYRSLVRRRLPLGPAYLTRI